MAILIDRNSKILIQGITGREASMVTKHTLDYGSPVIAGVTPGKGGTDVHGVPVYDTVKEAMNNHEINTAVVYVPPAFVYDAVVEALDNNIKFVFIATENVPQKDVIKFLYLAKQKGARVVGPNSVGIISPGERVKVGAIGGDNVERCFISGHVGVISRSGGMTAETSWMVKRAGYGISTSVSIGGDPLIGSPPVDLLKLFEADPDTHAVVTFSEPGTTFEEDMADFVKAGGFTKPLISFVAGQFTENLPEGTVFGHAGAIISGGAGKPSQKVKRLKEAGMLVADEFDDIITLLQKALS
ncbi:succinate--CoA ligase subunit alpha [Desulfoscipio geothermicus]|uniref:Succinyl-CoA synthetase alpha subunit n=1 Tax=Desulfoscipio geothermicus DSM 3669 TaxID=1121426 RepID=A0A1I6EF10_9FIRM|nr:CoA-binding protein [Desulfoscipio geothermicus]SFR16295.1 succinyl-CoA synthetase alpha subunit [Desulfoscipio geothermicus DSM 3669]